MDPDDAIIELYAHVADLERDMRYADASDALLVLADAEEERGETGAASNLRDEALRNYVTAWARQRWPEEEIHIHDVKFRPDFPKRRSRVDLQVRRGPRSAPAWALVTVGRRGDVRLEYDPYKDAERSFRRRGWRHTANPGGR